MWDVLDDIRAGREEKSRTSKDAAKTRKQPNVWDVLDDIRAQRGEKQAELDVRKQATPWTFQARPLDETGNGAKTDRQTLLDSLQKKADSEAFRDVMSQWAAAPDPDVQMHQQMGQALAKGAQKLAGYTRPEAIIRWWENSADPQMFPLLFGKKSNLDTESRLADNGNQSGDLVSAEDSKALKPLVNGPYIRNGKPYGRLKVRGKAEIEMLETLYKRDVGSDGILRDPNTGEVIPWKPGQPRKGVVDIGHKPGRSYNSVFKRYKNRQISLEEFRAEESDPNHFHLELPHSNRGRKYDTN